ncbi:NXPE family member 3-like [Haliotis rubra]|uniref:NXPE family member 3-like n=1 Tax=Haliotis rubra TaxID=36100 RepID=UPI001EE514FF|nr:NXPE family member 3-like [Haliotis rubra]
MTDPIVSNLYCFSVYLPARGVTYLTEEAMRYGTIFVPSLCAHPNKSRIYLKRAHNVYNLGDQVEVQIDLYDMNGNRKRTGGDFLRVWMEKPERAASISGRVADLNNGSYTALLKAAWPGRATIKAFIGTRREEIVLNYMIYQKHCSLWTLFAEYRANNLTDATQCSVRQEKSLKNELCNFTNENDGYTYYCRKSKIKQSVANPQNDILQSSMNVSVKGASNDMELTAPRTPCSKLPSVITWQQESPNGFFLKNKWHSLLCTDTLPRTIDAYRQCLRGKTLWLHGDSTNFWDLTMAKPSQDFHPAVDTVTEMVHNMMSFLCFRK